MLIVLKIFFALESDILVFSRQGEGFLSIRGSLVGSGSYWLTHVSSPRI